MKVNLLRILVITASVFILFTAKPTLSYVPDDLDFVLMGDGAVSGAPSGRTYTVPSINHKSGCALAKKIGGKAALKFKKDKTEGLKLFIKAYRHCPDDARLNFNLGLAYYRGNLNEAEGYLKKAVSKKSGNGDWLNFLSWVILETGSDKEKVFEYTAIYVM